MKLNYQTHSKHLLIYVLLTTSIFSTLCMEDKKIIEDCHGTIFTVPTSTLEKCSEFFQTISDFDTFDFETSDIWDQLFSKRFPKHDISFFQTKAVDVPLTEEVLKTAFDCIEQPKICESLQKDQIRSIFTVVNFLGPNNEKVIKKLAQRMKALIPSDELKEDNEIDYIVLSGLYEKSINTIIKKKPQGTYLNPSTAKTLNFENMKINTLRGIENLKIDKSKITKLEISNNLLTILDINYLLKEFPNLTTIAAEDCLITRVVFPKQLPLNMQLLLYGNNIEQLPLFHMNDNCKLDIRGNPLSEDAHEKIRKALIPPFLKRNKHYLYLFKETSKRFLFHSLAGTATSACLIWAPIGLIRSFKSEYPGDTPLILQFMLGIFSIPAYGIFKSEQLLGRLLSPSHEQFLHFVEKYALASGLIIGTSVITWKLYKNEFKHQTVQTIMLGSNRIIKYTC